MYQEWSTQPLAAGRSGWDWFSLHIDEETKLTAFRLRADDGSAGLSGDWISGGVSRRLEGAELRQTPL